MNVKTNFRFKNVDVISSTDNVTVYDAAKELLVKVIDNLDFINFRKGFSCSKSVDSIEYALEFMVNDEQVKELSNYMFVAPYLVKVDDVEYYTIVDKIIDEGFTVKFIFKVWKR